VVYGASYVPTPYGFCKTCNRAPSVLSRQAPANFHRETLFVAVLLTFLGQCVDYSKVPQSKSLDQVVIKQCTSKMSGYWSLGIWLYSFFFIWKSVQYFLEIRRLAHVRDFYIHLLEIPEQDMQTVSWQDIVARIMALREQNPKTAANIPRNLRRYLGSQSKERLDAHDIANRLMRKENFLIAMINKDLLNLSLPLPFLQGRHLFSKTMEWNLQFCILDMAFNELGQVQQDFLRTDRRGQLSQKLKQRFYFAGCLNLLFAPVVLAYVLVVYFFTYYNVSLMQDLWERGQLTAQHRNIKRIPNLLQLADTRGWLSGGSASLTNCLIFSMRD
jgi:autophagy-related protein 9